MNRTALVLLASGRSKRFGWRDKLLTKLQGKPLIEYAAEMTHKIDFLVRIAVCPSDTKELAARLDGRFVLAINKQRRRGMGHSIAVGVEVALKFKPDAILICMGDMPFVEPELLESLVARLGEGANIVHSGGKNGFRPPSAFDASCFGDLVQLDGDNGARQLMAGSRYRVEAIEAAQSMLQDIDTREDMAAAGERLARAAIPIEPA